MATEKDKIVDELFKIIQEKKQEISKAEKPVWKTNCAFRYSKEYSTSVNLQVVSDISELVSILAFLFEKESGYNKAKEFLGVKEEFSWFGYSFSEWASDIKTRIDKIQIIDKKRELERLEERLDKLVSKERREELEIEAIKKQLGL